MCWCADFAFTPPILPGLAGVCVSVRTLPSPCQSWLGFAAYVFVRWFCHYLANPRRRLWVQCLSPPASLGSSWRLGLLWRACRCCRAPCVQFGVVCALRVCGIRWPMLLRTRTCAVVVGSRVPLWLVVWPPSVPRAWIGLVALNAPVAEVPFLRGSSPRTWSVNPPGFFTVAAGGIGRPARNQALVACLLTWAHSEW